QRFVMLPGVSVHEINKLIDERGFLAEILREDWKDVMGDDKIAQANLSFSYPGTIRAWHRHNRGQVDRLIVLQGSMKICAYDDKKGSATQGSLEEITVSEERLQVVRIPGHYWHGTKTLGVKPSVTLYCLNRLYDPKNPDEERRAWDDPSILDPKTRSPLIGTNHLSSSTPTVRPLLKTRLLVISCRVIVGSCKIEHSFHHRAISHSCRTFGKRIRLKNLAFRPLNKKETNRTS